MEAVTVKDISKTFGEVKALQQLNFKVPQGEVFGLIGPDGAGKSTLFRILTSLLVPDQGSATVMGFDTVDDYTRIRKIIGYMPGKFSLYQDLSVEENLTFFATIFGTTIQENYHLIRDIYDQIAPFKKRRAGQLSGGMKQKLALSCALIHQPQVLFLDEPTTGVDAVSRDEFWTMLGRLKAHGITIIVSTPYMDEASRCERIALIQSGRLLKIDTPERMVSHYGKPLYAVKSKHTYKLLEDLADHPITDRVEPFGEYLHLTTLAAMNTAEIEKILIERGHQDAQVHLATATIEDIFLDLM